MKEVDFIELVQVKSHKLTKTNNINKPLRRGKGHLEFRVDILF